MRNSMYIFPLAYRVTYFLSLLPQGHGKMGCQATFSEPTLLIAVSFDCSMVSMKSSQLL